MQYFNRLTESNLAKNIFFFLSRRKLMGFQRLETTKWTVHWQQMIQRLTIRVNIELDTTTKDQISSPSSLIVNYREMLHRTFAVMNTWSDIFALVFNHTTPWNLVLYWTFRTFEEPFWQWCVHKAIMRSLEKINEVYYNDHKIWTSSANHNEKSSNCIVFERLLYILSR